MQTFSPGRSEKHIRICNLVLQDSGSKQLPRFIKLQKLIKPARVLPQAMQTVMMAGARGLAS